MTGESLGSHSLQGVTHSESIKLMDDLRELPIRCTPRSVGKPSSLSMSRCCVSKTGLVFTVSRASFQILRQNVGGRGLLQRDTLRPRQVPKGGSVYSECGANHVI